MGLTDHWPVHTHTPLYFYRSCQQLAGVQFYIPFYLIKQDQSMIAMSMSFSSNIETRLPFAEMI